MINRIYIDECGYTGEDLFNLEQPIFCLASISLSEKECQLLKDKFFSKIKAQELKHIKLVKSLKQQDMVLDFLKNLKKNKESVKFAIAHKHFVLLTKMVDLLVEPLIYEGGIDFYRKGANIAYSNLLYYAIRSLAGKSFFLRMIQSFQRMMRSRSLKDYETFFHLFFDHQFPEPLDELLEFFKASYIKHGPSILKSIPHDALDIAFVSALGLIARWSAALDGDIVLIHDKSSVMAKNKAIWDRIVNPNVPQKVIGYDRRKVCFPLRVINTEFANSKDFAGLQLVDVLAGATERFIKKAINGELPGDPYAEKLAEHLLESFEAHFLWPETKITPEELNCTGPDAEDPIKHFIELTRGLT